MRLSVWSILLSVVVIGASLAALGPDGLVVAAVLLGAADLSPLR